MNKRISLLLVMCILVTLFASSITVSAEIDKPVIVMEKTKWAVNENITMSWVPCENVDDYMVMYSDENMQSAFILGFTKNTSYELKLPVGRYYLEVMANRYDGNGTAIESKKSDPVLVEITEEKPVIVMEKTKWAANENITMSWVPCENVDDYMVMYSDENMQSAFILGFTKNTSYELKLPVGRYYLEVMANRYDRNGTAIESKKSDPVLVEITPAKLFATVEKTTWEEHEEVKISWQPWDEATSYEVMFYDQSMKPATTSWLSNDSTSSKTHIKKGTYYVKASGLIENEEGVEIQRRESDLMAITVIESQAPAVYVKDYTMDTTYYVDVIVYGVDDECDVVFASYYDSKLVEMQSIRYKKSENTRISFMPTQTFDSAKVMLWNSLKSMQELCEVKPVE